MALQAAGIAAGAVRSPFVLQDDPHLKARNFWHHLDRPFTGLHWQSSPAFREGPDSYKVRMVAPTLGQHNSEILGGMLGLSEDDLARLAAADIIGTVPKPRRPSSGG